MEDSLRRLHKLGAMGFCVSVVYGPARGAGTMYSVDVLTPDGQSFERPYGANDFEHCIFIAEAEVKKRGWQP